MVSQKLDAIKWAGKCAAPRTRELKRIETDMAYGSLPRRSDSGSRSLGYEMEAKKLRQEAYQRVGS